MTTTICQMQIVVLNHRYSVSNFDGKDIEKGRFLLRNDHLADITTSFCSLELCEDHRSEGVSTYAVEKKKLEKIQA